MKREDIEHLALLARVQLRDEEVKSLTEDVTEVLDYVSQISAITATEKEKVASGVHNVMREDEPSHQPGEYTEAILDAAPKRNGQYVEVQKILGDDS